MGKKARTARSSSAAITDAEVPVVGMREPCPCGSGKRYKACHGKAASAPAAVVTRPFEGFASECDIVALRELVPSATAPLTLTDGSGRDVLLCSVLPLAWPAIVRKDGTVLLGLQVNTGTGDASRDAGSALARALETEPGNPVPPARDSSDAPRLQDLVKIDVPLQISVHEGFDFWIDVDEIDGAQADDVQASLERANAYAHPTSRLTSVEAAYWTHLGDKEFLRWVMPHDEDALLNALARMQVQGTSAIVDGAKLIGMFRAFGIVAPVWELPDGTGAAALEVPVAAFRKALDAVLKDSAPLSNEERRARGVLQARQVTLR